MGENRIVIRGSYVISMDEKLGNLPGGDVLVEERRIVEVALRLSCPTRE
jgi:hypothetical protein